MPIQRAERYFNDNPLEKTCPAIRLEHTSLYSDDLNVSQEAY